MYLLHFAFCLILTGIRVCDSSEPTTHSDHLVIIESETRLNSEDTESFISSVTPPGYKFTHVRRNVKKGGGVDFFIKDDRSLESVSKNIFQAFESTSVPISTEGDVVFHILYRPPNLSK